MIEWMIATAVVSFTTVTKITIKKIAKKHKDLP